MAKYRNKSSVDMPDPAAVRLEERGDDAPVLVERFVELMQNAPVVIGKELLVRARGWIRRDALGEKEDELFPAKPPDCIACQ